MAKRSSKKPRRPQKDDSRTVKAQAALRLDELPKESDPSIRLIWVDSMEVAVRGDVPVVTLRFYSALREKLAEACRVQTSTTHLRSILDVLCRSLDYYPSKSRK